MLKDESGRWLFLVDDLDAGQQDYGKRERKIAKARREAGAGRICRKKVPGQQLSILRSFRREGKQLVLQAEGAEWPGVITLSEQVCCRELGQEPL